MSSTVFSARIATFSTGLAGISWRYYLQFNPFFPGFVYQEGCQLVERPAMQSAALPPAEPYPVTDTSEVFNGYSLALCLCGLHDAFRLAYYDWLAFALADSEAWRAFVRRLISEGRRDLIDLVRSMRPKEYEAMKASEVLAELDPQEQRKLRQELAEVIEGELEEMAVKDKELFERLAQKVLELQKKNKNLIADNPKSKEE